MEQVSHIMAMIILGCIGFIAVLVGIVDVIIRQKQGWAPYLLWSIGAGMIGWAIARFIELWG